MIDIIIKNFKDIIELIDVNSLDLKNIQSKLSWSLLIETLQKKYQIINPVFFKNNDGKPYLKNSNLFFNISHSNNYVAIIISDHECGIDIEYVNHSKDYQALINHYFSEEEQTNYYRIDKNLQIDYFYEQWTKKEAYLKMIGTGIKLSELKFVKFESIITTNKYQFGTDSYYVSYSIK